MVNARHTDLSVLYTIRLFQKNEKNTKKVTFANSGLDPHAGTQDCGTPEEADLTVLYTINVFFARFSCLGVRLPAQRGLCLRTGMHLTPGVRG